MEYNTIKYKFKKLSPMNIKKLNKDIDNYFIFIGGDWFNLIDIYESIRHKNNIKHPSLGHNDIKKINKLYRELILVEPIFNNSETVINDYEPLKDEKLLNDYIDLFEHQINELYIKQEEIYGVTQIHHHELEQINNKINI